MPNLFKQLKTSRLYWLAHDFALKFWWLGVVMIVLFWGVFFVVESKTFLGDTTRELDVSDDGLGLIIDWSKWGEEKLAFEASLEPAVLKPVKVKVKESAPKSKSKVAREIAKGLSQLNRMYPSRKYVYWKTISAKVTSYTPDFRSCGRFSDGKTSKLDNAYRFDGVAIAPKVIPYRSGLYIPGVGAKEADDTGGAMRQAARKGFYHIDVRTKTNKSAMRWGVRWKRVHLYKKS